MDLDKKSVLRNLRVWGLLFNLVGNALAIYGAIGVIYDGSRLPFLLFGGGLTLVCILLLARPSD